jgi:hypothetical protein
MAALMPLMLLMLPSPAYFAFLGVGEVPGSGFPLSPATSSLSLCTALFL